MRIHDRLHTYASLLLQQGESLAYIRDQLDHRSILVTVDIYGHMVSGCNKAVVDRLDDAPLCNLSATTMGKPPLLAVRLEKALPFRR